MNVINVKFDDQSVKHLILEDSFIHSNKLGQSQQVGGGGSYTQVDQSPPTHTHINDRS